MIRRSARIFRADFRVPGGRPIGYTRRGEWGYGRRGPVISTRRDFVGAALVVFSLLGGGGIFQRGTGSVPGAHAAQQPCAPTAPDQEGPFYKPNAPERATIGRGLVVAGAVRSAGQCA